MIRRLCAVFAAINMLTWAGPASAQAADNDVRCLTVSKFFAATEKDPRRREHAQAIAFFFLGRIDARLSASQLKERLGAASALIKQSDAGTLRKACAKKVEEVQRSLFIIGKSLAGVDSRRH